MTKQILAKCLNLMIAAYVSNLHSQYSGYDLEFVEAIRVVRCDL